jgi:hypothetical protein
MRPLLFIGLLCAACNFDPSTSNALKDGGPDVITVDADPNAPDADTTDAGPNDPDADTTDAGPNDPDANQCPIWPTTPTLFTPCSDVPVDSTNLVLSEMGTHVFNTDTGMLVSPGGVSSTPTNVPIGGATALVVGRLEVGINVRLRGVGSRPLIIVSWSDILVNGHIDVGSNALDGDGAGANSSLCSIAGDGESLNTGGGGGGGGGFGSVGGDGGAGDGGTSAGGLKGTELTGALTLRGGCPGGAGGIGDEEIIGNGLGGSGSGAVFLSARNSIEIVALVTAGGQGGLGAFDNRSAGGGGGSGGLIGFESPQVTFGNLSSVAANGGGGGGGGNRGTQLEAGDPGFFLEDQPAAGGLGDDNPPGNGGDGGYLGVIDGQVGDEGGRGGGGGGGGVGYIKVISPNFVDNAVNLSPAPTSDSLSL